MQKKKREEKVPPTSVRLHEDVLNRIDENAARKKWSRSQFIELILDKALDLYENGKIDL